MPIYEGIGSDKNSVVIEIGSMLTKCGFTSELSPRVILYSETYLPSLHKTLKLLEIENEDLLASALKEFLQTLYFKYLAVNPKDRRVVIVESIFTRHKFRNKLAHVLFKQLDVPSILFVPHHVMAMSTLGINSGLVLDIGYKEALAFPIIEGVTLLDSAQFAPLGSKSIHYRIVDELIQRKASIKEGANESVISDHLEESIVEDIKVKTCFVTTFERGSILAQQKLNTDSGLEIECGIRRTPPSVRFPLQENKQLLIPGSLRESVCEVLFEMYGEEHTLPTLVIDAILACPVDCRRQLASNIVLVGGTAMLPGLKHRLLKEIQHLTTSSKRYNKISFANDFKFHKVPCKENYASWLGASMFASSDLLAMRSLTYEQYTKNNELLDDWCDWQSAV